MRNFVWAPCGSVAANGSQGERGEAADQGETDDRQRQRDAACDDVIKATAVQITAVEDRRIYQLSSTARPNASPKRVARAKRSRVLWARTPVLRLVSLERCPCWCTVPGYGAECASLARVANHYKLSANGLLTTSLDRWSPARIPNSAWGSFPLARRTFSDATGPPKPPEKRKVGGFDPDPDHQEVFTFPHDACSHMPLTFWWPG